jgi:hypothetical protein
MDQVLAWSRRCRGGELLPCRAQQEGLETGLLRSSPLLRHELLLPREVTGVFQQILVGGEHGDGLTVDMLHRSESVLFVAAHGDHAVGARNLEDVEAMNLARDG